MRRAVGAKAKTRVTVATDLIAQIEAYYAGMTDEERAEDRQWAELAHASLAEITRPDAGSRKPAPSAAKRHRAR